MTAPHFEVKTYKWKGPPGETPSRENPKDTSVTGLLCLSEECKPGSYLLDFKADSEWSKDPTPTDFLVADGRAGAGDNYEKLVSNGVEFEWPGDGKLRFIIPEDNEEAKIKIMVLSARKHYLTDWKINYEDDPGPSEVNRGHIDRNLVLDTPATTTSEFRLEWLERHRGDYLHPKQLLTSKGIQRIIDKNEWFVTRINRKPIKLLYFGPDDGCNLVTALQTLDDNSIKVGEVHVVKDFNPSSQDDHSSVTDLLHEFYEQSDYPEPKNHVYGFEDGGPKDGWKKDDYYDLIIDTYALPWSPEDRRQEIQDRLRSLVRLKAHKLATADHLFPPSLVGDFIQAGFDALAETPEDEWEYMRSKAIEEEVRNMEEAYNGPDSWGVFLVPIGELLDDLNSDDLNYPEWQREDVWTDNQKVEYIESMLHDKSTSQSSIVIQTESDGPGIILDGKQRLTTLYQFANGEFFIGRDDPYTGEEERFFSDLDAGEINALMTRALSVQIISPQKSVSVDETSDAGFLILTFPRDFKRVAFEVDSNRTELENLNENLARIIQTDFNRQLKQTGKHKDLARSFCMARDDDAPGMAEREAADSPETESVMSEATELLLMCGEDPYEQLSTAYKEARAQKRGKLPGDRATSKYLTEKIREFLADDEKTHLIIEADGKWGKTVLTADSVCRLLDDGEIRSNDGSVSWFVSVDSTDSATPTSEDLTVIDDVQTRIGVSGNGAIPIDKRLDQWDSDSVCKKFILIVSSDASKAPRAETNADQLYHKLHALFTAERLERIHIAKHIFHLDPPLVVDVIKKRWDDMDTNIHPITQEAVSSVMSWCLSSVSTNSLFDILDSFRDGGTNEQTPMSKRCTALVYRVRAEDQSALTMPGIREALGAGEGGLS